MTAQTENNPSGYVYWATASCQHSRSCQGARGYSSAATVITQGRDSRARVVEDLTDLYANSHLRRCGWCGRPIAIRHFVIRRVREGGVVEVLPK